MAIQVLMTVKEGSRWVWAGDPDVTSEQDAGWLPAAETPARGGADVVEVHALNAEQVALVSTLDAPTIYYETIRRARPRVKRGGKWVSGQKAEEFISGLDWTLAIGLHMVVFALTHGQDPVATQGPLYDAKGAGDDD